VRLEWVAALSGLAATGGAVAVAILGTRHALREACAVTGVLLPLGALVYAALPPAWDFTTSGLETGLGLLWLGACWALLCRRFATADVATAMPRWYIPVVFGLGPLVRPDFAVFTLAFLVALLVLSPRRPRSVLRILGLAAALPVVTELARMAYYGSVVPNTAVAKEASLANWTQGWAYLQDFVGSYLLVLPVGGLLAWFAARWLQASGAGPRRFRTLAVVVVTGAVVHGTYIVRVGGDFMHARMLLPTLFMVLLPVSVVEVRAATGARLGVAAVIAWAVASALWFGPPYSAAHRGDAFDAVTGIADERLYWTRTAGTGHPVTIDDYLAHQPYARAGAATRQAVAAGKRGLLLDALHDQRHLVPLAAHAPGPIVASVPALGLFGYAAGDHVIVVDDHGLASTLAAHERLDARGRPGHEKALPAAWFVAEFADPGAGVPARIEARDVDAARRALRCGALRDAVDRPRTPLDVAQMVDNLGSAVADAGFRFAGDPIRAQREMCRN